MGPIDRAMAPAEGKGSRTPVPNLSRGITKLTRSQQYKRRGLWAIKKKNDGKFPVHEKKAKEPVAEAKVQPQLGQHTAARCC